LQEHSGPLQDTITHTQDSMSQINIQLATKPSLYLSTIKKYILSRAEDFLVTNERSLDHS